MFSGVPVGPSSDCAFGVMDDPVTQGVKAGAEPGFFESAVHFSPDILSAHDPRRTAIGPGDGESYDNEEGAELCWIGDVGVLNVEAACLGVRKETFHVPSPAVEVEAARAVVEIGCDNQQFAVPDALRGELQFAFRDRFHAAEPARPCSAAVLSQEGGEIAHTPVFALEPHVFLEADHEGDVVFIQEFDPLRADELPIRQDRLDRGRAEEAHVHFHQIDPLLGVGTATVIEQCPHQGHPKPACHDRQDENVHLARSERPLCPIKRKQPWPPKFREMRRLPKVQYPHNQPGGYVRVEPDELKEPLQAAIVRGVQGRARELARQMRQVDRAPIRQPDQQHRQCLKPRLSKFEMGAERRDQRGEKRTCHNEDPFWSRIFIRLFIAPHRNSVVYRARPA